MAVALHSEDIEIQEEDDDDEDDDINYENVETKTTAPQKHPRKRRSVRRRYRMLGMGFGLLCCVQALLNIGLRLSLYQSNMVEKEQLVDSYNQLLDSNNNLTEERDTLKRMLCESPGWLKFDRCLYYISTEKKPWEESRQWCRDRQSDLIVIKSKEIQDFVASFNRRVWLGLTDREREGSFKWLDGTSLTTPMYWANDAPNNKLPITHEEEDCVEYYDGSQPGFPQRGWNDLPCPSLINWICERVLC